MTSEKKRLPRLAVVTSSQLANRRAQSGSVGLACVLTCIGIAEGPPCWVEAIGTDIAYPGAILVERSGEVRWIAEPSREFKRRRHDDRHRALAAEIGRLGRLLGDG